MADEVPEDREEATRRFYDLVWPERAIVFRVATILTGSETEAEDLAQETMLKAFRAIGSFAPGTDIKAWLLTILRRTRIDHVRARASSKGTLSFDALEIDLPGRAVEADADFYGKSPEEVLGAFSDRQVIEALKELPEDIRMTLLLVDVQGLKLEEAAEVLEVPVGTVKSRSHRGRGLLRAALTPIARALRLLPK